MENYFFKDNMLNISVLGTGEGFQGSELLSASLGNRGSILEWRCKVIIRKA
jgi:hypothetical protein